MVRKALQWVTWSRRRLVTAVIVVIAVGSGCSGHGLTP